MKIGIIREGKTPPDKRVPFTPEQCKLILDSYAEVELMVQRSEIRSFEDKVYENWGLNLVDNLNDADVIFGVKEIRIEDLIPGKKHFFFSHTIKKQPYNRALLQAIVEKNVELIDYECLTAKGGKRLVGFGRYAGIVGTYNAFIAYGKRSGDYALKAAHLCFDRQEMEAELPKVKLPANFKIALTGLGRVAGGAREVLIKLGVKEVTPHAYLTEDFQEPVFTQLSVTDYFKKKDGTSFERQEAYKSPKDFDSDFFKFATHTDMYIPCHYWDSNGPVIFTNEDMQSKEFRIKTIADISCDIAGPIPSTIRPSTIADPIYEYDVDQLTEVDSPGDSTITVMAVDNLPCELPKDASEDFGSELISNILPALLGNDPDDIIDRGTIVKNGDLNTHFEYLRNYLEGKK